MNVRAHPDVIVVGGGLSGGLLSWRLAQRQPAVKVCLIEAGQRLGGNHTWSFFDSDLTPEQSRWLDPLVDYRWPAYEVRFPTRLRTLDAGYRSITSDRFHDTLSAALGDRILFGVDVTEVAENRVVCANGDVLTAPCVIDARGQRSSPHLMLGFQKFLGLEVRLAEPHHQSQPIIMDATVPQNDGYRFIYTLPFAPDRMLIEDTYYSDGTLLAPEVLRGHIADYATAQGWKIAEVIREESGVLPIILAGDIERLLADGRIGAPVIGLGAALFHPTTGYSLPDAVRLADVLASAGPLTTIGARGLIQGFVRRTWNERAIFRLLNRMLFKAGRADKRYMILQRFYGLDATLIRRFYAGRLSLRQKARLLVGRPPVAIRDALGCVSESDMLARYREA